MHSTWTSLVVLVRIYGSTDASVLVGMATPLGKREVPVPICCKVNGAEAEVITSRSTPSFRRAFLRVRRFLKSSVSKIYYRDRSVGLSIDSPTFVPSLECGLRIGPRVMLARQWTGQLVVSTGLSEIPRN